MKIVQLQAENVKRLSAVNIKPDGSTVVIGGRNAQGKSSVLDCVAMALGGSDLIPSRPIRNGQKKGSVTVDLGEMTVTRRFSLKEDGSVGSTLEIKNKDGFKASSPQKILDDLCGKMAFDPLEFSRLKPKAQLDALRELVGLDFAALDRERQAAFDRRTDINRQLKAKQAELAACPEVDAPVTEVSVAELMEQLDAAQATNRAKHEKEREAREAEHAVTAATGEIRRVMARIDDLKRQLTEAEQELREAEEDKASKRELADRLATEAKAMPSVDCDPIHDAIKNAESVNRAVRQNAKRREIAEAVESLAEQAESLTAAIEAIDKQKADQMAAAPFPVPGLGFDAGGITLNGLPFDQASSAEQLRVSVAMGLALNPKLRVMLIRDGSLLDDDSMALVAQMAEEADAQVWIERVGEGEEVSVVIEDGHVKAAELVEA